MSEPLARSRPSILQISVAGKIFSLAVLLLMLTVILTGFLLSKAAQIREELDFLAEHDVPLSQAIAKLDYLAVNRHLAFERWYGAVSAANPDMRTAEEASANYIKYRQALREGGITTQKKLGEYPAGHTNPEKLAEVRLLFESLLEIYPRMTAKIEEVMALQQAGQRDAAREGVAVINELQNTVEPMREKMDARMASIAQDTAMRVAVYQQQALWISIAATITIVSLGLLLAWIISRSLTRPIRNLATAMDDVQKGNLKISPLVVHSHDEVGQLTDAFNFFVDELRSKEMIKKTFGKYIDPRVLDRVLLQAGEVETINRRTMTVSFADIVGFSGLSERLTPAAMVAVLNRHFELQTQMIHQYQGVVDKFMGDAVMAFWGPPFVSADEHAVLACHAALAQTTIINTLRQELPDITGLRKDTPVVDVRIGLCSGGVVVGNIGSDTSRSYTVIGDTVNIASRLEGANRVYGTSILISDTTREAIGTQFEVREIDLIAVKGRSEPTRIYELLGVAADVPQQLLRLREQYALALQAYRAQDWVRAESLFGECLSIHPADTASRVFLERIAALRLNPPGVNWDGVWRMTSK